MSKILITGGAGFIGSNLARHFLGLGHEVCILDNFSTGRRSNLSDLVKDVTLIEGDIRYYNNVLQAVKGCDYIFHEAALPSVLRSVRSPIESNDVNIGGTLNILLAAKENNVKRVVYAASSSAYGDSETLPKIESMRVNPKSPYAINKLTGELYCRVFYEVYGLQTISLRYFNVFGPYQDPSSYYSAVIPKFINQMQQGERPTIFGDGLTSRDFTFIDNVVKANELAMTASETHGETINIGTGERYSLNDLVFMLNKILKTSLDPIYAQERDGDVKHSLADISKAKQLIDYLPEISFNDGLKKTVEWYTN